MARDDARRLWRRGDAAAGVPGSLINPSHLSSESHRGPFARRGNFGGACLPHSWPPLSPLRPRTWWAISYNYVVRSRSTVREQNAHRVSVRTITTGEGGPRTLLHRASSSHQHEALAPTQWAHRAVPARAKCPLAHCVGLRFAARLRRLLPAICRVVASPQACSLTTALRGLQRGRGRYRRQTPSPHGRFEATQLCSRRALFRARGWVFIVSGNAEPQPGAPINAIHVPHFPYQPRRFSPPRTRLRTVFIQCEHDHPVFPPSRNPPPSNKAGGEKKKD